MAEVSGALGGSQSGLARRKLLCIPASAGVQSDRETSVPPRWGADHEPPLLSLSHWLPPAVGSTATGLSTRQSAPPGPAPPLPGFKTGIPMAQAQASNLLSPRPGRAQQAPRAEHTLALQLSNSAVHDRDPRPQAPPAPVAGSLAVPRRRQGPPSPQAP